MLFRSIFFSALIVGVLAGLVYGLFQQLQVSPIIYAAETFEVAEEAAAPHSHGEADHHHETDHAAPHSHGEAGHHPEAEQAATDGHHHDPEAWAPADGMERVLFTLSANVMTGFSFALILVSLMALHNLKSNKPKVNALRGIGWGIAGLLVVFVAPALFGLHPEVPGTEAAALENRQLWWTGCALATAIGIAILYYAPAKLKGLGILVAAVPHMIGAPMPEHHGFANMDPVAVQALTELTHQFFSMTAIGMAIFFVVLGALSGLMVQKFVKLDADAPQT